MKKTNIKRGDLIEVYTNKEWVERFFIAKWRRQVIVEPYDESGVYIDLPTMFRKWRYCEQIYK